MQSLFYIGRCWIYETDFSWVYNRPSYSAWRSRVTVALSNTRYLEGNVNDENFATKVRLNGQAGRGANGTRRRRERKRERGKERKDWEKTRRRPWEMVRDLVFRRAQLARTRTTYTRATTCWKASARSLHLVRSRHPIAGCKDKQVSCVLIRGWGKEEPVAGGSEGRAKRGGQEEGRKRCKGEARPLNTCRRYERRERERETQKREIGSIEIAKLRLYWRRKR